MKVLFLLLLPSLLFAGTHIQQGDSAGGSLSGTYPNPTISTSAAILNQNSLQTGATFYVSSGTVSGNLIIKSHLLTQGTVPVLSSCGTSPVVVGSDMAGTITVGGGVVLSCTLTFATAFGSAPICSISDDSTSISPGITSVSNSAFTVGFSASLSGGHVYYHCIGTT